MLNRVNVMKGIFLVTSARVQIEVYASMLYYNPCILKKTCIEKCKKKRNAAGGAEENEYGFIVCKLARVIYSCCCCWQLAPLARGRVTHILRCLMTIL